MIKTAYSFIVGFTLIFFVLQLSGAPFDKTAGSLKEACSESEDISVISYLPYYKMKSVTSEIFDHLTHVNYFALGVNSNGDLGRVNSSGEFTSMNDIPQIKNDLDTLKKWRGDRSTKIFVVLGGWVQSDYFDEMASGSDSRAKFIQNVKSFLVENELDGADIDWEGYKGAVVDSDYKKLLTEMGEAFEGTDLKISVAIGKTHTSLADEFMECNVEHIGLMTYGKVFDDGMQVSPTQLKEYVSKWEEAGASKEKLVVGVPFYGRTPSDGSSISYREIVSQHNPANSENSVVHNSKTYYYNGVDAIKTKANYVKSSGLKGIMIWEQGQDVELEHSGSLLKAISDVIPVNLTTSASNGNLNYFESAFDNLRLFPSPFTEKLNISFRLKQNSPFICSLFDMSGVEVLRTEKKFGTVGTNMFSINMKSLSQGVYVLNIEGNNKRESFKIVKQ